MLTKSNTPPGEHKKAYLKQVQGVHMNEYSLVLAKCLNRKSIIDSNKKKKVIEMNLVMNNFYLMKFFLRKSQKTYPIFYLNVQKLVGDVPEKEFRSGFEY